MLTRLFEKALDIVDPWYIKGVDFDEEQKGLTIKIDFVAGTKFAHPSVDGFHPVHDTVLKEYRHLNFFQHTCHFEVRVPRVKLPDGKVVLISPPWAGQLSGLTLLFEALVVTFCQRMPFDSAAKLMGESYHRVRAVCGKYVDLAVDASDLSDLTKIAVDETSKERGHSYLSIFADAEERKVVHVTEGKDSKTVESFISHLESHGGDATNITSVSMDMSVAFIKGVDEHMPNARKTFDKFHIIQHANEAVSAMRKIEVETDPSLKGLRNALLKGKENLTDNQQVSIDGLTANLTTCRTARAWQMKENLRDILDRKQINVVEAMLKSWCNGVMRSKVEPMKKVAKMIRKHWDGVIAWAQTRQSSGFLEAINGLFQAAKRKARGYTRMDTMRTVIFLIAGKLDFKQFNRHIV